MAASGNDPAAIRRRPRRTVPGATTGFTLVEVLVVILLIAILSSIAILSIPTGSTSAMQHTEAHRLQVRMSAAREEAILGMRPVGLYVNADSYHFLRYVNARWERFPERHPLAGQPLPDGIHIDLSLEGIDAGLDASAARDNEPAPQIHFLPGGEILPDYALLVLGRDSAVEYRLAPGEDRWIDLTEDRLR